MIIAAFGTEISKLSQFIIPVFTLPAIIVDKLTVPTAIILPYVSLETPEKEEFNDLFII
jgi:hypothetical protein